MPRILAIDYGTKRSGIAVTDPMQIIATGLETVATHTLEDFLAKYLAHEKVEAIVVGNPKKLNNTPSETSFHVKGFVKRLAARHPEVKIELVDERFTSVMANQAVIDAGSTRAQRKNKGIIDLVSAVLILQNYLETKRFSK